MLEEMDAGQLAEWQAFNRLEEEAHRRAELAAKAEAHRRAELAAKAEAGVKGHKRRGR